MPQMVQTLYFLQLLLLAVAQAELRVAAAVVRVALVVVAVVAVVLMVLVALVVVVLLPLDKVLMVVAVLVAVVAAEELTRLPVLEFLVKETTVVTGLQTWAAVEVAPGQLDKQAWHQRRTALAVTVQPVQLVELQLQEQVAAALARDQAV
jgi:hypothetical protein